ncbi:MAG: PKD domain-containing protein, partial [Bacteroidales bacterium]|nr:PKD domain-containing protein [Bacteroidales bacterium]
MNKIIFFHFILFCIATLPLQAQIPTTDLKLWLKADAGVVMDGSNYVSEWQDQSGNGFHLTQTNSTNQPKYQADVLQELPVIRFDGNDFLSIFMGEPIEQPVTLFVVWKLSGNNLAQYIISGSFSLHRNVNNIYLRAGSPVNSTSPNYTRSFPSSYVVTSGIINSSVSTIYENGLIKNSGNASTNSLSTFTLGHGSYGLQGDIAELFIYSSSLNESERIYIEKYLMDKYSPPLNLGEDICNDTVVLSIDNSFSNVLWSTGETTKSITVSEPGTYFVEVTDNFDRVRRDTVEAFFFDINLSETPEYFCFGESVDISAEVSSGTGYSYSWNTGGTNSTITTYSGGDFWVVATNSNNCSNTSDTVTINLVEFPETFSLGNDTTLCSGNYFAAPYNAEWDYQWDNGDNTYLIQIIDAGEYIITATDEYGCIAYDTIDIDIQGIAPQANFSFPENNCVNTGVVFNNQSTGVEITGYTWDFGDGSPISNEINPIHVYQNAGEYIARLEVYSASG